MLAHLIAMTLVGNIVNLLYQEVHRWTLVNVIVLIFSIAFVHLAKKLVVNVMKIVYTSCGMLDSPGCKVLLFAEALTMTLAI